MDSWREVYVPGLPGRAPETMIWDSARAELAVAAHGQLATLYACGITPYDATHIGHAATYIAWDLLVRAWRDAGHGVRYVQNVTDVDDPLLERAAATGQDWRALADREIALYRTDMEALRVLPPAHYVGAVEAIGIIDRFNRVLADHGALYDLDGDVYFARSADPAFGAVSGLDPVTMVALSAERGGDPGRAGKKDPLDPLVWLAARPHEPAWDSEFGSGRPGWHVECAAIATHYVGATFDIQAGGSDLRFPHHEMSASHARVALAEAGQAVYARRYAHAGMVRLDGEKMSKSLGNLVFVSALLSSGADPMAVRLAILAHHYRTDWDWTDQGLAAAAARLARWRAAMALGGGSGPRGGALANGEAGPGGGVRTAGGEALAGGEAGPGGAALAGGEVGPWPGGGAGTAGDEVLAAVRQRLADDLDAPGALAVIDRWAVGVTATGRGDASSGLVRSTADALLGIAL